MRLVATRNFATPWRLDSLRASGTPAFACYQSVDDGPFTLGAVMTLILRDGYVTEIASFLDPVLHRHLGLPAPPLSAVRGYAPVTCQRLTLPARTVAVQMAGPASEGSAQTEWPVTRTVSSSVVMVSKTLR
jgi:hypothetical protein